MKLEQSFTLALDNPYFELANLLDYCEDKDQAIELLFNPQNAGLVFTKTPPKDFITKTLYHFCRSRLAYFQQDFAWFQKETSSLIIFWLEQEALSEYYLSHISKQIFLEVLTMGKEYPAYTKFPYFLLSPTAQKNEVITWLKDLKNEKAWLFDAYKIFAKPL